MSPSLTQRIVGQIFIEHRVNNRTANSPFLV